MDQSEGKAVRKGIYRAIDAAAAEAALAASMMVSVAEINRQINQSWRRAWGEVLPFYAFPGAPRRTPDRTPSHVPAQEVSLLPTAPVARAERSRLLSGDLGAAPRAASPAIESALG
jgi:hypothetical protein